MYGVSLSVTVGLEMIFFLITRTWQPQTLVVCIVLQNWRSVLFDNDTAKGIWTSEQSATVQHCVRVIVCSPLKPIMVLHPHLISGSLLKESPMSMNKSLYFFRGWLVAGLVGSSPALLHNTSDGRNLWSGITSFLRHLCWCLNWRPYYNTAVVSFSDTGRSLMIIFHVRTGQMLEVHIRKTAWSVCEEVQDRKSQTLLPCEVSDSSLKLCSM